MGTKDGYKVIKMATPQKTPAPASTDFGEAFPSTCGHSFGRWEHKVSLETRDPEEAKRRFTGVNAAFEAMLKRRHACNAPAKYRMQ
jgi:hypothetical protein